MNSYSTPFAIEIKNLSYKLKTFSLENVSLNLEQGKIHVILGSTGSGKTLLLEILAGVSTIQKNQLFIYGKDAINILSENRNIAYLPQDIVLFPNKNVLENILYPLRLQGNFNSSQAHHKIEFLSKQLGIYHLLQRTTVGLSGGERQRIALARTLITEKHILILDEPTSAIHESLEEEIFMFLKEFHLTYKPTMIIATHSKDGAFFLGDLIHFMEKGKIELSFNPRNILKSPVSKTIAPTLGIKNIFPMQLREIKENFCLYYCDVLKTYFHLSENFCFKQKEIYVGIRPHDIRAIKSEDLHTTQYNKFELLIERIYFKEINSYIVMRHIHTNFKVYMEISIYTLKKMNLQENQVIHCKIKENYSVLLI